MRQSERASAMPGRSTAALELAQRGFFVFPLATNSKTPITLRGHRDATTDPKRIDELWRRRPSANLGIACGASELVVVDIDVKHKVDGWDSLTSAMDALGQLPGPTRMASTPSGGAHLYFRAPEGVEIRNSVGKLGPGLDVRALGGYVVAPPSVIDGKAYGWDVTEAAKTLPKRWAEALQKPEPRSPKAPPHPVIRDSGRMRRYGAKVLNDEADEVARAQPGTRNDTVTRSAFRVGTIADACGISGGQAEEMFAWAVSQWGDAAEAQKAADSFWRAFEAGRSEPRQVELRDHG